VAHVTAALHNLAVSEAEDEAIMEQDRVPAEIIPTT
jgi:hypothetical protein